MLSTGMLDIRGRPYLFVALLLLMSPFIPEPVCIA